MRPTGAEIRRHRLPAATSRRSRRCMWRAARRRAARPICLRPAISSSASTRSCSPAARPSGLSAADGVMALARRARPRLRGRRHPRADRARRRASSTSPMAATRRACRSDPLALSPRSAAPPARRPREEPAIGSVGAGTGATTADLKGGFGTAETELADGVPRRRLRRRQRASAASRSAHSPHFRAAAFERDGEFGGLGLPSPLPADAAEIVVKRPCRGRSESTTLAVVATDCDADPRRGEAPRHRRP